MIDLNIPDISTECSLHFCYLNTYNKWTFPVSTLRGTNDGMSQRMQLLCSTGTFSRYPDYTHYEAVLKYAPHFAVDGFELMFYPAWYPELEHIANELRQSGLKFPVIHTEKNIGAL